MNLFNAYTILNSSAFYTNTNIKKQLMNPNNDDNQQNASSRLIGAILLATVYRPPGPYTDFLKELADFLSDLLVNVDKALIVGDFNIHVDNTNDALGLAFTDLINSFGVKQNVTGPTHRFNHTLDLIISHEIDLTGIDIVPQSDVTDHFLVSCMLHITDINYMAPRYRPGRTIVLATKDRFTNNLPDLSQLLYVPINTDELDKITSNMGTIFSNTVETVAPSNKKRLEKNVLRHGTTVIPILSRKKLVILSANGEKLTWNSLELHGKTSQVTYVTMFPRVGNDTLRPLGVAMGNAFSVTRV